MKNMNANMKKCFDIDDAISNNNTLFYVDKIKDNKFKYIIKYIFK